MSNANDSVSVDGIKEGLGKLASPASTEDFAEAITGVAPVVPGRWDRAKTYAKRTVLVLLALSCIGIFGIAGLYLSNPTIRQVLLKIGKGGVGVIRNGFDPTSVYNLDGNFPPEKRKSLTVLVLGSDHDVVGVRKPGHTAVPQDVPNAPGRSDAIMIARFDFDGDTVSSLNVLSIPRDTRVRIPGHGIHKINAAHAYGGPLLACATIQDVFGITPDYYVDLNFEGFQQIVDAVGGVDVNVHQPLDYDDNWGRLHIHLKPGQQHLNGYRAMGYVRFRHTDNDLARAQRQHEFLEALRSRVTSPATFLRLPGLVNAVTDNLHSNLSMDQLLTLTNLARKAPKDAVTLETLPVIEGKTFVYIDRRKSVGVIRKMFFKDKLVASDLEIKTPDMEIVPSHRRKRHAHDALPPVDGKHHDKTETTPAGDSSSIGSADTPMTAPTSGSAAPEASATPDRQDRADKPAAETPKTTRPDNAGSDDVGKPPAKGKDGTGTSSGSTSTVVSG